MESLPEALQLLVEDLELNHEYCPKEVILQAAAELRRLHQQELAAIEWHEKTDWVRAAEPHEIGMHRADVLRERITKLHNEIVRLNSSLKYEQDRSERIGTHGPGCHLWGHRHHECLEREYEEAIEALRGLVGWFDAHWVGNPKGHIEKARDAIAKAEVAL